LQETRLLRYDRQVDCVDHKAVSIGSAKWSAAHLGSAQTIALSRLPPIHRAPLPSEATKMMRCNDGGQSSLSAGREHPAVMIELRNRKLAHRSL